MNKCYAERIIFLYCMHNQQRHVINTRFETVSFRNLCSLIRNRISSSLSPSTVFTFIISTSYYSYSIQRHAVIGYTHCLRRVSGDDRHRPIIGLCVRYGVGTWSSAIFGEKTSRGCQHSTPPLLHLNIIIHKQTTCTQFVINCLLYS